MVATCDIMQIKQRFSMPYSFGAAIHHQMSQNGSTTTSNKSIHFDELRDSPDLRNLESSTQAPAQDLHRANSETIGPI